MEPGDSSQPHSQSTVVLAIDMIEDKHKACMRLKYYDYKGIHPKSNASYPPVY